MTPPTSTQPSLGGQRLSVLLYGAGMFAIFLGERLIGGEGGLRLILDGAGVGLLLGGLGLIARDRGRAAEDQRAGHQLALGAGILGLLSLVVYAIGTEPAVDALGFADEEAEHRYETIVSAVWPILWLAASVALVTVDRVLAANPMLVQANRTRDAFMGGLGLAFALSLLFPLNYLATEHNERWDYGYFKTARPGTSTQGLVGSLEEPINVFLFFPNSSDITDELRTYFDLLDEAGGDALVVSYVDHALEPELAKDLRIRSNGYIALVRGEGEEQQVERIRIGDDFDSAKSKLRRLDEEVNKSLLKMARGKRVAYFTAGHGELHWSSDESVLRSTANLRKLLRALNYSVKELSLAEGLGSEVPEDATMVVVLGPESDLLPEEQESLDAYRKRGGSLLVALEPGGPALDTVLRPLGISYDPSAHLAHDSKYAMVTRRITDRGNLVTNEYSTHASVTTLSRNDAQLVFIAPGAGRLDAAAGGGKTTTTVRSLDGTFADLNGDFEFNSATETRQQHPLAIAAAGPIEDGGFEWEDEREEYRVIAMADATWAADAILQLDATRANFQYVLDAVAWLGHDEDLQGTIESEEDVKITHAKEEQGWVFYGTGFIIPLGLFGLGLGRISLRRRRGNA